MSKRSNPYVEDFIPQSKTHVGLKQFNNNEDRMQKVYEKTLRLLFKGAKKSPEEEVKILNTVPLSKKGCLKQLVINKDGTLVNSKIIHIQQDLEKQCPKNECDGCGSTVVETSCSYCEAQLCCACSQLCARCSLSYCSKCSLLGSEGTEICVSCYG